MKLPIVARAHALGACLAIGLTVLTVACVSMGPEVRMYGTPRDLAQLAGTWDGEYIRDASGERRGTISFVLLAGDAHAHGDVIMIADGSAEAYMPLGDDSPWRGREQRPERQALTVRFVTVDRNVVAGVLDTYWDPDLRTTATSTFRGKVSDDLIEGTFVTEYATGAPPMNGRWKVRRTPGR